MEWIGLVLGVVSLVGSLVMAGKQASQEQETIEYNKGLNEYNKDLNQTIMDREDNAWQRAVEDRSKSGLSVAGLSSGSGSGGSVSHLTNSLQAPQSSGQIANLLSDFSSQSFGLASSAYDRKLQKQIASDELQVKKQELDQKKEEFRSQRILQRSQFIVDTLRNMKEIKLLDEQISSSQAEGVRQEAIYNHNLDVAKRLGIPYGQSPNTLSVLLGKGSEIFQDHVDDIKEGLSKANDYVVDKSTDLVSKAESYSGIVGPTFTDTPELRSVLGNVKGYNNLFNNNIHFEGFVKEGSNYGFKVFNSKTQKANIIKLTADQYNKLVKVYESGKMTTKQLKEKRK